MAERDDRTDHAVTLEEQDPLVTTPGRRRFMWTTLALIAIAVLVVASIVAPGGSDDEAADAPLISEAISVHAAELSGLLPPDALVRARCAQQDGREYSCVVDASNVAGVASGSGGGVDTARLIVVLADDESLTKRLGGPELDEAPRAGDAVAAAIAADDKATLDLDTAYGCAFGPGLRPDGGRDDDSPGGFRCTVTRGLNAGADEPTSRYVEFADDGTLRRDFVIAGGGAGAPASAGPAPAG